MSSNTVKDICFAFVFGAAFALAGRGAVLTVEVKQLQAELDWWKCENKSEQPPPPTLVE